MLSFGGLTTRRVDALGKQTTHIANAIGAMARSADHTGYYQQFDHDAFGNTLRVVDSLGYTLVSNVFNLRGMRTEQTDLAAGRWTYTPNALGEVTSQTDANEQTATFEYDLLGRLERRIEHIAAFLADRVARIMTPLVPVLLIIALLNATVIHTNWSLEGLSTGFVALLGNLLLVFDYPVFQLLDIAHVDVWWRIRPYNTAEPLWTVAIEFWIYIAASLLVFGIVLRERIRPGYFWMLALISVPVVIWNAADGAGKSLSLVWIVGGMAGFLVVYMGVDSKAARSRALAACLFLFGATALIGRTVKLGFDPYDLQTAFLMTVMFFGLFLRLNQTASVPKTPARLAKFFASYSYSLYLVHNTVLVIVFENTAGLPKVLAISLGVVLAHAAALLIFHCFEKHHRVVGSYLRPIFSRHMMRTDVAARPEVQSYPAALQAVYPALVATSLAAPSCSETLQEERSASPNSA